MSELLQYVRNSFDNSLVMLMLTSTTAISISGLYLYHLNLSFQRAGEAPVVWSWLPLLGNALDMGSTPIEFLQKCSKKHKDIFGMIVAGHRMFIITDPFSTSVIFKPLKSFSWTEIHNLVLINFFGISKGLDHEHFDDDLMRKWFSTYILSDNALEKLTTRMQLQLHKDINSVPFGQSNLYEFLSKLIFKASVASLFTEEAGNDSELFHAFLTFDKHMPLAMGGYKVDYASGPKKARELLLKACLKHKNSENSEIINKRWVYFDSLVAANHATAHDIIAYQLAMLWASVGNTMPTTFWLMYYLLTSKSAMNGVMAEVDHAYQSINSNNNGSNDSSNNSNKTISQNVLNSMIYTDACITETLRLVSGSLLMRHVQRPSTVTLASGQTITFRAGDRVGICPPLWHYDDQIFARADEFLPERWMMTNSDSDSTSVEQRMASANGKISLSKDGKPLSSGECFLPFGGGTTLCPGRRFARNEVKTLVVYLLRQFQFELVTESGTGTCVSAAEGSSVSHTSGGSSGGSVSHPGFDGSRAGIGIFPPKKDVPVHITRRNE